MSSFFSFWHQILSGFNLPMEVEQGLSILITFVLAVIVLSILGVIIGAIRRSGRSSYYRVGPDQPWEGPPTWFHEQAMSQDAFGHSREQQRQRERWQQQQWQQQNAQQAHRQAQQQAQQAAQQAHKRAQQTHQHAHQQAQQAAQRAHQQAHQAAQRAHQQAIRHHRPGGF